MISTGVRVQFFFTISVWKPPNPQWGVDASDIQTCTGYSIEFILMISSENLRCVTTNIMHRCSVYARRSVFVVNQEKLEKWTLKHWWVSAGVIKKVFMKHWMSAIYILAEVQHFPPEGLATTVSKRTIGPTLSHLFRTLILCWFSLRFPLSP